MEDERLLKQVLFGELKKKQPYHGVKKRWRDQVSTDLQAIGLKKDWYQLSQDRNGWFTKSHSGVEEVASCRQRNTCATNREIQDGPFEFECECRRPFRRRGDLTRHKRFCENGTS